MTIFAVVEPYSYRDLYAYFLDYQDALMCSQLIHGFSNPSFYIEEIEVK